MKTVKSYTEYTKLLKAAFYGCEKMPEQRDIQLFIDSNSLYDDWKILVSDVSQDIRTLILKPKAYNGSPKKKRISSYKQCVFCGDAAAVFFDGRADKGDHADPDESFGEKGALNILPICIGCGIVLNKNGKPVDKFWSGWYTTVR